MRAFSTGDFAARIGADQQDRIGLVDAADAGIEDVAAARPASSLAPSWRQSMLGEPRAAIRSFSATIDFGIALIAGDGRDLAALELAELLGDGG